MRRRHVPQSAIDAVKREFPGISGVRAHQIYRDREKLRERERLRRRAASQAAANLYGELPAGGIGPSAHALVESFDHAPHPDEYWITEGGFDAASLAELS